MKNKKRTFKMTIEVEVPFKEYNTEAKNKKAERAIRNWILEGFLYYNTTVPLYIEKKNGSFIEDISGKLKAKIR